MESANIYGGDPGNGDAVAREFGYSKEELDSIPKDANLGLSCGNPLALANVKEVSLPNLSRRRAVQF